MTREEAIRQIENRWSIMDYGESEALGEALEVAIKALQTINNCDQCEWCCPSDGTPTIHVVRCKDCKHWHSNTEFCGIWSFQNIAQRTLSDDYCSRAERREE